MDISPNASRDTHPHTRLHTAELIKYRDERKTLVFTLSGGDTVEGSIRWFDEEAIHVVLPDRDELTLFKHAIHYYRSK